MKKLVSKKKPLLPKKAFTLVELLGVIVLLGVIGLITIPVIQKTMFTSKESLYKNQVSLLEESARKWGVENAGMLPTNKEDVATVSFETLKKAGLIAKKDITDPRNGKEMPGCVLIFFDEEYNQYLYRYNESCDENAPELRGPIITVLGKTTSQAIEIDASDRYNVPVGTAVDYEGNSVPVRTQGMITPDIPGTYKIIYIATDNNGVSSKLTLTIAVKDNKPPTVNFVFYPDKPNGDNGWYKTDLSVILGGSDEGSGIVAFQYAVDTGAGYGAWVTQAGNTVKLSTEGTNLKIKVRSKDAGGNYSDVLESALIKLDKTKPTVGSLVLSPSTWTSGNVTLTATGTDNLSGVAEYSFDEGLSWQKEASKVFATNQTVNVMVRDLAGNISLSKPIVINNIETTKPTIEFAVVGSPFNAAGWANNNFNVNIIPHYGASGLKNYSYCLTTGSSCTPLTSLAGTSQAVTVSSEGVASKICATATDQTGNNSGIVCSGTYKLDKTAPSFTNLTITKTASNFNNLDVTLGLAASDANGLKMNISNNGYGTGSLENYTNTRSWNVGGTLNGGVRTVYVEVSDLAGNKTTRTATYTTYSECSVTYDSSYGSWGACSATCGGGTQSRSITKSDSYTGKNCGNTSQSQACNTQSCASSGDDLANVSGCTKISGICYFRGANPNNYITYNDETWRIINIQNNRLKIVRSSSIGNSVYSNQGHGYIDDYCYNGARLWSESNLRSYLNGSFYNSLSATSKSQVSPATWYYIGGQSPSFPYSAVGIKAKEMENAVNDIVGLLSMSDYAFTGANASCQDNINGCGTDNWLHSGLNEWTQSSTYYKPYNRDNWSYNAYIISGTTGGGGIIIGGGGGGKPSSGYATKCQDSQYAVRPSVFLNANLRFKGNGTQANPYVISS